MSTYMPKAADLCHKWYVIDAAGQPLGRVAAKAAHILRGKHKVTFVPHLDCGDSVVVVNCDKAVLTGKKLEKKLYHHHSGWVGGLKTVKASELMQNDPGKVMMMAVKGMLPDTTIGRSALTRLRVYSGPSHKQQAQQPEPISL